MSAKFLHEKKAGSPSPPPPPSAYRPSTQVGSPPLRGSPHTPPPPGVCKGPGSHTPPPCPRNRKPPLPPSRRVPLSHRARNLILHSLTPSMSAGSLIAEYTGEVVTLDTFWWRMANWYAKSQHHYALHLDSGLVIDAYHCGSIARYVNHSCQPNCHMQKWWVSSLF